MVGKKMDIAERKKLLDREFSKRFGTYPGVYVQAPGRVDLMGSHTDYNQGYVLTQAIDRNTVIAARPRTDGLVRIASLTVDGVSDFELTSISYDNKTPWTNYVRGVADVFQKAGHALTGFDGLVHSTIPFGSGLSSSAALEVATGILFVHISELRIDPVTIAKLCLRAENEFVGLNCGILDQYSSTMSTADSVLLLDCQTITHKTKIMAPGIQVMICDTRAKRALTGSEYPQRRAQCEEGVRILAGFYPGIKSLRDVSLEQVQAHKSDLDPVVYKRCHFIVEENQRVLDMADVLEAGEHHKVGQLANESFQGARDLYEIVSAEMIAMHTAIMSAPGAYGARGAGAGFGGCLVAFIESESIEAFTQHVHRHYAGDTGIQPDIYPVRAAQGAGVLTFD
jgi:galactokinase